MTDPRTDRPSIVVNHQPGLTGDQLAEILNGIEEESIPFDVRPVAAGDALAMAHAAALESRLGVGIGIAGATMVVTLEKLPPERPYIREQFNLRRALDRAVGTNAARLVKRTPLRDLHNEE